MPVVFTLCRAIDLSDVLAPLFQRQRFAHRQRLEFARRVRAVDARAGKPRLEVRRRLLNQGLFDRVVTGEQTTLSGSPSDVHNALPDRGKPGGIQTVCPQHPAEDDALQRTELLNRQRAMGNEGEQLIEIAGRLRAMGKRNRTDCLRANLLTAVETDGDR
ncbi:hypothetical protein D3C81_1522270 [compost metagenome]